MWGHQAMAGKPMSRGDGLTCKDNSTTVMLSEPATWRVSMVGIMDQVVFPQHVPSLLLGTSVPISPGGHHLQDPYRQAVIGWI